jgi:hypothetical protein
VQISLLSHFHVPALSQVFSVGGLSTLELLACVSAGLASVAWFEPPKLTMARQGRVLLSVRSPDS